MTDDIIKPLCPSLCPSCGMVKDFPDKFLCKYCYTRGYIGTMRMVILGIFDRAVITKNDGSIETKKLSAEEVVAEFNKLPFIKREANVGSIKKYLIDWTGYRMLSKSKVRNTKAGKVGAPRILHRITVKGKRRLKAYLKKWNAGHLVLLTKHHKKLKLTSQDYERSSAIRGRLQNPAYDPYQFIFPQRISAK